MSSLSTQPIPISTNANRPQQQRIAVVDSSEEYSPRNTFGLGSTAGLDSSAAVEDEGSSECPPQFLSRTRQSSTIQLDVFHHPAEIHTPTNERQDPFAQTTSGDIMANTSPRINTSSSSPGQMFDAARSPVLAIHHSRGAFSPDEEEDGGFSRTISGLSLSLDTDVVGASPRRVSSFSRENDTTYVPMTPLPHNCILSFLDRPREMKTLMSKNQDLFRLIEHAVPHEKYKELLALWRAPREKISDEEWVQRTRSYIAMDPDEDAGGVLWTRWRELVGWDPDPSPDEDYQDDEWNYQPFDTSLHRKWSEIEKLRGDDPGGRSFSSSIGLSGVSGSSLTEICEGEEELEDGERIVTLGGRTRNS